MMAAFQYAEPQPRDPRFAELDKLIAQENFAMFSASRSARSRRAMRVARRVSPKSTPYEVRRLVYLRESERWEELRTEALATGSPRAKRVPFARPPGMQMRTQQ